MASKRELTPLQQAFLEALFGEANGDVRTAMNMAGYAKGAPIGQVVRPLKDEIVERAAEVIGANSAKAAIGVVAVLDDPSTINAQHKLKAAESILDRCGITKKEDIRVTGAEGGIFILPRKDNEQVSESDSSS